MSPPLVVWIIPDPSAGTGIQGICIIDQTPGAEWDGATLFQTEDQNGESDITDHPVETGTVVSDNVRAKPEDVSYTFVCSQTPATTEAPRALPVSTPLDVPKTPLLLSPGALLAAAGDAIAGALFGAAPAPRLNTAIFVDFDPPAEMHAALEIVRIAKAMCTVITTTRTLENMVITKVSVSKKDPGMSGFTVALRQIFTASILSVTAPQPLEPRGQTAKSGGAQAPALTDVSTKKGSSLLLSVLP